MVGDEPVFSDAVDYDDGVDDDDLDDFIDECFDCGRWDDECLCFG